MESTGHLDYNKMEQIQQQFLTEKFYNYKRKNKGKKEMTNKKGLGRDKENTFGWVIENLGQQFRRINFS